MVGTGDIFFYQTITSITRQTRDAWGDHTAGSVIYTNVPTRFVFDTDRRRAEAEDERVDALAYIGGQYTSVQPDDAVVFDSVTYRIIKVFLEYDLFGNVDHVKLTLRKRT
jgi:hypothetical protein